MADGWPGLGTQGPPVPDTPTLGLVQKLQTTLRPSSLCMAKTSPHQERSRSRPQPSRPFSSGSGWSNPRMFPPRIGPKVSPSTAHEMPQASQHLQRVYPPSILLRPLRRQRVSRRCRAPECVDPASAPDVALMMPTTCRELQIHPVHGGKVGATPALRVGSPDGLFGFPKGKYLHTCRRNMPRSPGRHDYLGVQEGIV